MNDLQTFKFHHEETYGLWNIFIINN